MSAQIPSTMKLKDLLKPSGYDCPEELLNKTFAEATSGGEVSTNTDATVDVSTYTEPVEIEPAEGYDATKKVTVTLENIPSGADLESNHAATIDVSAYTEPVEIEPAQGKDGMEKVTVTLGNIPSGSLPAPYRYMGFSGCNAAVVFSGPTELVSVSEDGENWYNNFKLVQWQSSDLSFELKGGRVVIQYNYSGYNVMAAVTPIGTENPSEQGWYEKSGGSFNQTSDTSVEPGKTYYTNFYAPYAKCSNGGEIYTVNFNISDEGPLTPDA